MKKKRGISLCMIVKNEAETIREVLEAALKAVDELVILVDTSTTDNTKEICQSVALSSDIIRYYRWQNDFSAARNTSISLAHHEWILILDGHEILAYADKLKGSLKKAGKAEVIFFPIDNYDKGYATRHWQPRMFKNDGSFKYEYAMHNQLTKYDNNKRDCFPTASSVFAEDHVITHRRSEQLQEERALQRTAMLENFMKKRAESDASDYQAHFYYGTLLMEQGQFTKAHDYFVNCYEASEGHFQYAAQICMALCLQKSGSDHTAIVNLHGATTIKGCELLPTAYLHLGEIYLQSGRLHDYHVALNFFLFARDRTMPIAGVDMLPDHYTYAPYYHAAFTCAKLACAYQREGNSDRSKHFISEGIELCQTARDKFNLQEEAKNMLLSLQNALEQSIESARVEA